MKQQAVGPGCDWVRSVVYVTLFGIAALAGCDKGDSQTGALAGGPGHAQTMENYSPDPDAGQMVFKQGCITCHGANAQGLPHQGASLRTSRFIASHSDGDLIRFIHTGRPKNAPDNVSGNPMPPDGNIAGIDDQRLADLVAWLRRVQREAKEEDAAASDSGATGAAPASVVK
jgi:mono/diheme cytochrome c family protein